MMKNNMKKRNIRIDQNEAPSTTYLAAVLDR